MMPNVNRTGSLGLALAVLAFSVLACASAGDPDRRTDVVPAGSAGAGATTRAADQEALLPAGFGSLRQDDFTLSLRSGALLIKVTPLSEQVIRLAAPDTYDRLTALAGSRRAEAQAAAGEGAELFLVSFFSYEPDIMFQPEDLQLTHGGRQARAIRILPMTPGWGSQRLRQQETQTAIYIFEPRVDYDQQIVLRYGLQESDEWSRVIPRLELERGRVRSQAGTGR
jgi:hypothetical protein